MASIGRTNRPPTDSLGNRSQSFCANSKRRWPGPGAASVYLGSVGASAYGARSTDYEIELCVRREKCETVQADLAGTSQAELRLSGIEIPLHVRIAGKRIHGMKSGVPGTYPGPAEAEWASGVPVPPLPRLIECLLARTRLRDLAYVIELIGLHNLTESFADEIHAVARSAYLQCLDQKRDEDRYNPEIHDHPPHPSPGTP